MDLKRTGIGAGHEHKIFGKERIKRTRNVMGQVWNMVKEI